MGWAGWNRHVSIVSQLVDAAGDINAADKNGLTPANAAASTGHLEVAQLILDEIWSSATGWLFKTDHIASI